MKAFTQRKPFLLVDFARTSKSVSLNGCCTVHIEKLEMAYIYIKKMESKKNTYAIIHTISWMLDAFRLVKVASRVT